MPILPDKVRRFILTSVASVPHLEAMLLLRTGASETWSSAQVGQRLYIRESDAAGLLAALSDTGIARCTEEGNFVYAPPPELAELMDAVAECYATNLLGVTELIHSRIDRRAHQFADAFRIRRQGGDS